MEDKLLEKILANLRVGIAKVESSNFKNPYEALPPVDPETGKRISSATGKYQFLKAWLKDDIKYSSGKIGKRKNAKGQVVDGIATFAKKSGVFGEIKSMEDFKNNPELQEAYFTYYAKNVLIPEAQKIAAKNPLGLSIDEIASQIHFQGYTKARDTIQSGKLLSKTKDNASQATYLDRYNEGIAEKGLSKISDNESIKIKEIIAKESGQKANLTPEEKQVKKRHENKKENFAKEYDAIDKLDVDQSAKEKLRRDLFQKAVDGNYVDSANEYIEEVNNKKKQEIADYKELLSFAKKLQYVNEEQPGKYVRDEKGNLVEKDGTYVLKHKISSGEFFTYRDSDHKQFEKLSKKYNLSTSKNGKGYYGVNTDKLFEAINEQHKSLTGQDLNLSTENTSLNDLINFEKSGLSGAMSTLQDLTDGVNPNGRVDISFDGLDKPVFNENQKIDPSKYKKKKYIEVFPDKDKEETVKNAESKSDDGVIEESKKEEENLKNNSAEEWFNNRLALNQGNTDDFNIGETKGELPIDALMGLALGIKGREDAKNTNIPLRNEEISDSVKNYIAELAKRSNTGLPVEVEAKMKSDLAEGLQAGLLNIVNASEGNSATVLANMGRLDDARNKGLLAIQMADYEAKEKAFQQYGQAIMYENDFNSRRDIANHGILYTEAKENQRNARELANAGFAKLIDGIKYQKENGPGSANDMYRSLLMQKMFGFDPRMKDDGTGMVKGTKSYFDKQKGLLSESKQKTEMMYKKFGTLNPEQKKALGLLTDQTSDENTIDGMMDYLKQNPNVDLSKISMDNLNLLKEGNFDVLFSDSKQANTNTNTEEKGLLQPNEIMLSQSDIDNAVSGPNVPFTNPNPNPNTNRIYGNSESVEDDEANQGIFAAYNNYYQNQ